MGRTELESSHLADLHAMARELGVPRFRMLSRDELIAEIDGRGGEGVEAAPPPEPVEAAPAADEAEVEPATNGAPPEAVEEAAEAEEAAESVEEEPPEPTEDVSGLLEVLPQGYGFLRVAGLDDSDDDVYVSASQIRRCELLQGDEVAGPVRAPRRGERHRALVHVELVNGAPVAESAERTRFESLTPVAPHRRIAIEPEPSDVLVRAATLLVPLAFGQRVLVHAAHRSGRTTLLRGLAAAISAAPEPPRLVILLADERPEEATEWRRALPDAAIAAGTADTDPRDQAVICEIALARAQREVESGADVVVICDSLTRLALGFREPEDVKRFFGVGRELEEEEAGSLTVIATVLADDGEDGDDVLDLVYTTENALIRLDPDLAAAGVSPALVAAECRASDEEKLRDPDELVAVRRLRELLADLDSREAAALLRERIEGSASNEELLRSL
jgi:transcription termination factor Rho